MDQRRWDELDIDCMTNIFGRVGMESLLLDVPFVCKPWYKASLNPSSWQNLIFPVIEVDPFKLDLQREYPWKFDPFLKRFVREYRIDGSRFSVTAFIKFVISRSRGHATDLRLPAGCSEEALKYAADMCPGLKRVSLSDHKPDIVVEILSNWKDLEWLLLGECRTHLEKIVSQISIHCKNFTSLNVPDALIGKIEAVTIATLLPNIKHLNIRWATIDRSSLGILLRGCKELVSLDARDCVGFDPEDETVLKLASHIRTFCFEGSRASDYGGDISCRPS